MSSNQNSMFINRPGLYFGQCSEICGIEIINIIKLNLNWLDNLLKEKLSCVSKENLSFYYLQKSRI